MANMQLLNNVQHQDIKIITQHKAEFGDDVGGCLIFPEEFLAAHREYPIVLQKDPESGEFQFIVLFGFQKGENLFLTEQGWTGNYIPALMRKEPFLIGFQEDKSNPGQPTPVIHVDLDSPRIGKDGEGEPLFLANGGNSPLLESIRDNLMQIHEGIGTAQGLMKVLQDNDLIEQFTLDVVFKDGNQLTTDTYYTVNQEKLMALPDEVVVDLHRRGVLQLTYMMMASTGNIKTLIEKRNKLL